MPILRPVSCFLAVVILLLSTTQRLPGPIVEVEETPTPAPVPTQAPVPKSAPAQKEELSKRKHSAPSKTPVNRQVVTKPETRAKPTSPPRSQGTGRVVISRAANFGWNISLHVQIDGKGVGSIPQGGRYDGVVPTGHHVLTVSARGTEPTSVDLDVQPGQNYTFTTVWDSNLLALRPSR
jgi:hypothetical protein